MDLELITYWNVETLALVLNGVAALMGGDSWQGLLKLMFLLALMVGMFAWAGAKTLEFGTWFLQALVLTTVMALPVTRIILTDKTGIEPPRTVSNVPFGLGVVAYSSNLVFGWMTGAYETVFGVPDELTLARGDLGFGHRILRNVNKAVIRDPGLRADMIQYAKECALYDIKDGIITPEQLVGATGTMDLIFADTNPARFVTYDTLTATPVTVPCTNAAVILRTRIEASLAAAQTFYGKQNFPRSAADGLLASTLFGSTVGTSYDWLLGSAASASEVLKQAMFNNLWRDAGSELPAVLGDSARLQELQSLQAAAMAAKQAEGQQNALSILGQEAIPHVRNWIEAILFAVFPIVVAMTVIASTEQARRVIGGYAMALAWIGMWPVMFAVINHLSMLHLKSKLAALGLAAGVPFQLSDAFDATVANEQAMIGYMVLFVPFLSGAIIKMAQGGFMGAADKLLGGTISTGAAAGGALATGNLSIGQAGLDTASANNTTMNKLDTNASVMTGGRAMGLSNGDVLTTSPGGQQAIRQFSNQMRGALEAQDNMTSMRGDTAGTSWMASSGRSDGVAHAESSALNSVVAADRTRASTQSSSVGTGLSVSGSEQGSYGYQERLGQDHSAGGQFTSSAGAGTRLTGGGGLRLGGSSSGPAPQPRGAHAPALPGKVVDDFGNEVQVGGSHGAGDRATRSDRPGARSGAGFRSPIDFSLGAQTSKDYSAAHTLNKYARTSHDEGEQAGVTHNYGTDGRRSVSNGTGENSAQSSRVGRDAVRSSSDSVSRNRDVSQRHDATLGSNAGRTQSRGAGSRYNFMADPGWMANVAQRNGVSVARFSALPNDRQMAMIRAYADETEVFKTPSSMPSTNLEGTPMPANKTDVNGLADRERQSLPPSSSLDSRHRARAKQTGARATTPLSVDVTAPPIAGAMREHVRSQLDANSTGSMPQRARDFDQYVHDYASPDKPTGAGRANPHGVVEDAMVEDGKDTLKKLWDRAKGGDGTSDGKKIPAHERSLVAPKVEITKPKNRP